MSSGKHDELQPERPKPLLTNVASLLFAEGAVEIIAVLTPDSAGIEVAAAGHKQSLDLDINGNWLLVRLPEEEVGTPGVHFVMMDEET